jgi:DNA-binding CsgD family transcriptional regulator
MSPHNSNALTGPDSAIGCRIAPAAWRQIGASLALTDRELQIVQHIFAGAHERQIGEALGISEHTVHTHLGRIYRKLGVRGMPAMLLRVFAAYVDSNGDGGHRLET